MYDRISICPKCYPNHDPQVDRDEESMLKEYWDIGMLPGGELLVEYDCWCSACGFEHRFRHREETVKNNENKKIKI